MMTREFAWKPRSAVIMLVISVARSTFDISSTPAFVWPKPAVSGCRPSPSALAVRPTASRPAFQAALVAEVRQREVAGGDPLAERSRFFVLVDVGDPAVLADRHVVQARAGSGCRCRRCQAAWLLPVSGLSGGRYARDVLAALVVR